LSFGLYGIWWMYETWSFFKRKNSLDIMPVWRSIFSVFFIYDLFKRISDFAKQNDLNANPYSAGLLTTIYIVLCLTSRLPDPYWFIAFGAAICFISPVNVFNSAISNSDKYRPQKTDQMSGGQIAIVIIGSLFWLLIVIGLTMPAEAGY
jgi:hypothetical protein